jgi:hypothetical protein
MRRATSHSGTANRPPVTPSVRTGAAKALLSALAVAGEGWPRREVAALRAG